MATLPSDWSPPDALPPEGDHHYDVQSSSRSLLRKFFERTKRRIYIAGNMAVFYPGEKQFSPDLYAVTDVEIRPRDSWIGVREGKGLDLALEISVTGRRSKDLKTYVEKYARLGIREYFVFDVPRKLLRGWRLPDAGATRYEPLVPQLGCFSSEVLGLELFIRDGRLRFMHDNAVLEEPEELISRLNQTLVAVISAREEEARRAEDAARRAEEAAQGAEEAARRRQAAEQRLAAALEEIERLKKGR
ncbi:MAG: Uma2 family endonuclease [Myxococcota bacterium]